MRAVRCAMILSFCFEFERKELSTIKWVLNDCELTANQAHLGLHIEIYQHCAENEDLLHAVGK